MKGFTVTRTRLVVLVAVVVLAVPAGVFAADQFRDVPADSPHHDAVERVADAGITLGCETDSPRYCPQERVTRGQMASFLDRGLSRGYFDSNVAVLDSSTDYAGVPASVTVDAGARRGGGGYVLLQGSVTVYSDADVSSCPCEVEAYVYRARDDRPGPSTWAQLPGEAAGTGKANVSLPVTWAAPIQGATSETYRVGVFVNNGTPAGTRTEASLTATYVPFGEAPDRP